MQITCQSILSALGFLSFILAQVVPPVLPSNVEDTLPGGTPVAKRPKHSQCYNYFLAKDDCVFSAAKTSERCSPNDGPCGRPVPEDRVQVMKSHQFQSSFSIVSLSPDGLQVGKSTSTQTETTTQSPADQPAGKPDTRLVRRYDSEMDSFPLASGTGICGEYTDDTPGVCLWASASDSGAASGGWLNGTFTKTCGRKVFIQRKGADLKDPSSTIYAPVVDGCTFNTKEPEPGCFRIAFTKATFAALKPTHEESSNQILKDIVWDFSNFDGSQPQNAAP